MNGSPIVLRITSVLEAVDRQRAAIDVNWNHQNPDIMNPAELDAVRAAISELAVETTNLAFAFGGQSRVGPVG
jgi:hypothetical protein